MTFPASVHIGRLSVQSRHLPATLGGGGDFHDIMATPFGIRLLIGDVMGTGLLANQTGLSVLNAWRELARTESTLAGIAARLHALITRRDPDRFVTALMMNFPDLEDLGTTGAAGRTRGSRAELVCCGHPPPLLLRDGSAAFIEPCAAPPLGLLDLAEGWCQASMLPLGEGDQLLLYTDGLSEARDDTGRFFPLAEHTAKALTAGEPAAAGPHLLDALVASVLDHVGERAADDILLLLVTLKLVAETRRLWCGAITGSWGIVIAGPGAHPATGMKLCRGEARPREEAGHGDPTVAGAKGVAGAQAALRRDSRPAPA